MFKKAKFPVAVTLLVQAFAFTVLFLILACKKKSIAGAFLAVAAMEGAAGTLLLAKMKEEIKGTSVDFGDDFEIDEDALKGDLSRGDDDAPAKEIPCEDASESEFKE